MRDVQPIWDAWRSGSQVGDTRPCTRVTVEKSWWLNATGPTLGTWNRGPAHWYQPANRDAQIETELPNVISFRSSRSLDTDAGTCDITLQNAIMPVYGQPEIPTGQFGEPGYYTFDHGVAQDARARWSHAINSWHDVLRPNALLRTYQGYGGHTKPLGQAITDGNVVLNGVWLIDDIQIGSEGEVSLKCRDMMKLLIDQQLFPPLVPANLYPPRYRKYSMVERGIPKELPPPPDIDYHGQYFNSSTDVYYGEWGTQATGHPGYDALDKSFEAQGPFAHQSTYWLSEPFASPNDAAWIEFFVDGGNAGNVNEIYYHPFEGKLVSWPADGMFYVMVSIVERGAWAGPETNSGGVTPHGIPYVSTFVPGRGPDMLANPNLFRLPRMYEATIVRLTVTNLLPMWDGSYRAGARKVMACRRYRPGDPNFSNIVFTGAGLPVNNNDERGYWQVRSTGQIYAFGDARVYWANQSSPRFTPRQSIMGIAVHPQGHGYWIVDDSGVVIAYGDAAWFGDTSDQIATNIIDIAAAPDGNGYWLLHRNGQVWAFGSAVWHGNSAHSASLPSGAAAMAQSIEPHPTTNGYWVMWTDGYVTAHNVTHRGNGSTAGLAPLEYFTALHATSTGNGYWMLAGIGRVSAFGDATNWGSANGANPNWQGDRWYMGVTWDLIPSSAPGNAGYMIQHADGTLDPLGDNKDGFDFGSIASGTQKERTHGNYSDYSDIVRDLLLWSGFYLYRNPQPTNQKPDVFGNIESTGAWAEDDLPEDMFEKRPVYDAIKDLRDIVGYVFYADVEGGVHWESPSWWALGNYLLDHTPFGEMPEIDESVNLTSHRIQYSGQSAYSEIIIATEDPMPQEAGRSPNAGITQTRVTPKTAPDLRGMTHLYMRTNMKFSRPNEQKVMADLIDMKMWFSRRLGAISCAANPLFDLNDQVRVIERTTGEVYVHYIRGIDISHDIESGDFSMDITTHWLGGGPFDKFTIFYAGVTRPQSDGYWTVTLGGTIQNDMRSGIYPSGGAQIYDRNEADSHTEDVIAMRTTTSGAGMYTLDRTGKVITYGDAVHRGQLFRSDEDVVGLALTPSGNGYWILRKDGTVNAFGDASNLGNATITGTLNNGDGNFAVDIESHPAIHGYWTLTANGTIEAHGPVPFYGSATLAGRGLAEWYATLRHTSDGGGYWAVTGGGFVSNHGNAPHYGNGSAYPESQWWYGLTWDLLAYADNSYALLHADGSLEAFGGFTLYSPVVRYDTKYWALVPAERAKAMTDTTGVFPVSADVIKFLSKTGSQAAANALAANFGVPPDAKTSLT